MLHGFFCLLFLTTSTFAYPTGVVEVEWGNVPNNPPPARNLNSPYLGECVCDFTRDICDPFCCCDKDCSAATRGTFFYCLPETHSSPSLDYCYPKDRGTALHKINNIEASYIDNKRLGYNAVCVIRTNRPSELYRFFKVPTKVQQPSLPNVSIPSVAASQPYSVGDPLAAAKYVQINGVASFRRLGPFQLPTTTSDGSCRAIGRSVGFLDSIQGITCTLNGAQLCLSFPVSKYENLFLQAMLGFSGTADDFVPVTLNLHDTSGALLESIDPSIVPAASAFATNSDGEKCNNAIVALYAHFSYSSKLSGKLVGAMINITLSSVGLTRYVALSFQATFTDENTSVPSNILPGTPGYLPGNKVRAGTYVTLDGKSAILERKSGFAVPAGGRLCGENQWKRASFLYSILSAGCQVLMSESDLQEVCSSGTRDHLSGLVNVIVNGTPTILDRVAVTNDALTNDTTSWIPISGLSEALTNSPGIYDAYTRQCKNIAVGLHYQFVIARAGTEYNAQDIIVGAFASPILGTLRIWNVTDFSGNALSYQQIIFRVSFSRYEPDSQETIMRRVVAPRILPRLDDSIFYPFCSKHAS
ncbi:hypothetical protein JKF63_00375 [Porcisia hertigi]|uniref:Tectonic-1-3 N-terminal domain-containing protein n=1 Tax=Porcisia hertigi TaxID=2761500 RepID=A0A836I4V1_9TRYP|nr:hypothetical protein JKF63_00375 [Porcisia hertigi]